MTPKPTGGPAFPVETCGRDSGMTLRDWFAGQALSGLLADDSYGTTTWAAFAEAAYAVADAMIEKRNKDARP